MINKDTNKTVCHLSFTHSPFDDRIYWKELISLQKAGYKPVHIAVGDKTEDFVTAEGIRMIIVKRKRLSGIAILNTFLQLLFNKKGTIGEMLNKARTVRADVYHYHDHQINAIAGDLKKFIQKPKIIYDNHEPTKLVLEDSIPGGFIKKELYTFYIESVLKWEIKNASLCDHIIATDFYTLDYFEKKLPLINKTIVFNYSYFIPSEIESQEKKEYHFIYSGFVSKNRGVWEMINGIRMVKSTLPGVRLLIIGRFESERLKKEVLQSIIDLNLQDNVTLQDSVPFKEMQVYYKRSMIGLGLFNDTPKYNNFIPIKLFEYMAFGLPVIFSDLGPPATMINETNCGVLVDINDAGSIAAAMQKLLAHQVYFNELGKNGKLAVETKYNWNKEQHKLIKLYENLIK